VLLEPKKATTFSFIANKVRRLQSIAITSLRHYDLSLRPLPIGSFRKLAAESKATEFGHDVPVTDFLAVLMNDGEQIGVIKPNVKIV
jgi:hypothetical protein